jgi:hypothetical protein
MLQIKEDSEDLIPTFSDHEYDGLGGSRDRIVRRRSSKGGFSLEDVPVLSAQIDTLVY